MARRKSKKEANTSRKGKGVSLSPAKEEEVGIDDYLRDHSQLMTGKKLPWADTPLRKCLFSLHLTPVEVRLFGALFSFSFGFPLGPY